MGTGTNEFGGGQTIQLTFGSLIRFTMQGVTIAGKARRLENVDA
jgi:hypothetical protein